MANEYSYTLLVQQRKNNLFVEIKNPFTVTFDIKKNNFTGPNMLTLKVFNLGQETRESIRKDQLFHIDKRQDIIFNAGMNGNAPMIFNGTVLSCTTGKEGNNIVTNIVATDHAESRASVSKRSYKAGTPYSVIVDELITDLAINGVGKGYVATIPGVTKRGYSIFKKTTEALAEITKGQFFIENRVANVVRRGGSIPANTRKITADQIIGSPSSQNSQIFLETLFFPAVVMGQMLEIESRVNPQYNGVAKVFMINHKGTISGGVRTSVTTQVGLKYEFGDDIYRQMEGE